MPPRILQLKAPAEATSLASLRSFVVQALVGLPQTFVDCVVLAVDEACSNIVRHRRPELGTRDIDLTVVIGADRVHCRIGSFCAVDDLPRIRPHARSALETGGRGTHFISCLMDRVDYLPDAERPGALVLVLEKVFPQAGAP